MDPVKIAPTDKQATFIANDARYSCMSGGFGSGKSFAGCLRSLLLSQFPKNRGLIGRLTYPELRDTTRKTFFEVCPPQFYDEKQGGRWSPSENNLTLINGSEIMFRHLDTISEAELKSMNLGWFFIDQAEEISLGVWQILQSRLRLNVVPNRFGFVVCNPEPGCWIEDVFKKPFDEHRLPPSHFYMDTTTFDNPYNPPDYVQSLLETYPEELRKRYIEGRWDTFQNQIYTEFDQNVHVIKPFRIPDEWERVIALDHGMVNPTGVLWSAIDYDGNVFMYDEYYSPGIVSDHAKEIIKKTGAQNISMWLIDPSTRAKTREKDNKAWSVIEEYEDNGLYFMPANNEKLAGINRVKEFFKIRNDRINPFSRTRPAPRLYIMQNCVNLIWELKQYKWRKLRGLQTRNEPEQTVDFADHLCDALRYTIMSRFPPPARFNTMGGLINRTDYTNKNVISEKMPIVADDVLGSFGGHISNFSEEEDYGNDGPGI